MLEIAGGVVPCSTKRILIAASMLLVFALSGCQRTARLYNLATGEVFSIVYKKKRITGTMPSGEKLNGEYSTIQGGSVTWGNIYASVYGSGGSATGSSTGIAVNLDTQARGSAIATGDRGTIIECEYIAGTDAGAGACKDNRGNKYKLMF